MFLPGGTTHFTRVGSYILFKVSSPLSLPLCSSKWSGRLSVDVDESMEVSFTRGATHYMAVGSHIHFNVSS